MLQMYWVRVRTDCIESIFCRWLQWPYKAGSDKGYPVRTLSVGEKKRKRIQLNCPLSIQFPRGPFKFWEKNSGNGGAGPGLGGRPHFSQRELAHKLHFSISLSLWDICCTLRIYCSDFRAASNHGIFFLPASSLKLQICTRSAWSRKNWAIGVRIVVRVRKLPILHLTSPKRRSSLGKWHNRLDRLVLRKWGTANSVFSPFKWSTSDSCNFCDIQSKAKNDIGVPNWMILWTSFKSTFF